eukprot:13494738-Alexandrium_andersonii.AAC.1
MAQLRGIGGGAAALSNTGKASAGRQQSPRHRSHFARSRCMANWESSGRRKGSKCALCNSHQQTRSATVPVLKPIPSHTMPF